MIAQHRFLRAVVLKRHLRYSQRHAQASLAAAAFATAVLVVSNDNGSAKHEEITCHPRSRRYPTQICDCEPSDRATSRQKTAEDFEPKALSRLNLLLYASKIYPHSYLPVPRLLAPRDPLFAYPELKRGLLRRRNDEERVKQILSSPKLMEARKNQDQAQMQILLKDVNSVVYGEGITPQIREDFLMQYGCTGYTDDILQYLVEEFGHRGMIEVGAGNGQWAKALSDCHRELKRTQQITPSGNSSASSEAWEFILAYDNMKQLPLSPKVYHKNTVPAKKYFSDVQRCASHIDAVQGSRGRSLLLVYPPPGSMPLETVLAYLNASPGYVGSYKNDTVVYVGEGRGGANADDAFFDYFLGCDKGNGNAEKTQWILEKVMDVRTCPGGKGYEKMFVFRRRATS